MSGKSKIARENKEFLLFCVALSFCFQDCRLRPLGHFLSVLAGKDADELAEQATEVSWIRLATGRVSDSSSNPGGCPLQGGPLYGWPLRGVWVTHLGRA